MDFKQDSIREWLEATQERSTIEDVTRHGCQGGTISELIYYHDTSAFYQKYKEEIWNKLEDTRADMGLDSILKLVATFNGHVGSDLQLQNLLAWWAAEITCQEICIDWDTDERATA
jgi:hypothetical protein